MSKRYLALLLTLVMVFQVIGTGFAFADGDDLKVTIEYKDENGTEHKEDIQPGMTYTEDGVEASNNQPNGGIEAKVDDDSDIDLTLSVDGNIETQNSWNAALTVGDQTTATVDGDITSYDDGVITSGTSVTTVNGDVTAGHINQWEDTDWDDEKQEWVPNGKIYTEAEGEGVIAKDNSEVTINGNLSSQDTAVNASNKVVYEDNHNEIDEVSEYYEKLTLTPNQSEITINGDVTSNLNQGVVAEGESKVTINGSLQSESKAISTTGGSFVEVTGNVNSDKGSGIVTGSEVKEVTRTYSVEDGNIDWSSGETEYVGEKESSATVIVGKDLTAYENGISVSGTDKVKIGGNVAAGHLQEDNYSYTNENGEIINYSYSYPEGFGVTATDNASVDIGKNLTSASNAISAVNSQKDINDSLTNNPDGSTTTVDTHINEANQVKILVKGNVTSNYGYGVKAEGSSEITIGGSLSANGNAITATGGSNVEVKGNVESQNGTGIITGTEIAEYTETRTYKDDYRNTTAYEREIGEIREGAFVSVGGNLTSSDTAISTAGKSTVNVEGSVVSKAGAGIKATGKTNWYDDSITENKSSIHIGESVTSYETGISASGESSVTVGGDVTAGHEEQRTRIKYVNGETVQETYIYGSGQGVNASEEATVAIGGNMTSEGTAITTSNNEKITDQKTVKKDDGTETVTTKYEKEGSKTTISVAGDVTSNHGNGVQARGESTVTIGGSLKSEGDAVSATGSSKVEISGSATSTNGNGITTNLEHAKYTSTRTYTVDENGNRRQISSENDYEEDRDGAVVTVGGDVTAYNSGISASGKSSVSVGGNVTSGHEEEYQETEWDSEAQKSVPTGKIKTRYVGDGVTASDDATVTVGGNLISEGTAVNAKDNSKVEIGGDATSKHGSGISAENNGHYDSKKQEYVYDKNKSTVTVGGDLTAYNTGISASGDSVITVGGNVTAGHEYEYEETEWDPETERSVPTGKKAIGYEGSGVIASDNAKVTIGGNLTAEETAINAESYNYEWTYEYEEIENADGTKTYVRKGTKTEKETNNPVVDVAGDVTSKHGWTAAAANEEATIKIGGSVNGEHDGIRVTGDAAVTVGGDVTTEDGIAIVSNKESLGYTNTSTYDADGNYISGEYKEKYGNAGTVEVGGDVTAKNNTAIDMTGKSKVIAWGDVTGGYVEEEEEEQKEQEEERELTPRQQAYEDALAEAFSDVEKLEKTHRGAISIRLDEEDNDGLLIVGGTVKANEGNVPVVLNYTLDNPDAVTEMPELSDMKIFEIAPNGGEYFDVNIYLKRDFEYTYVDEETGKEVTQKTSAGQYVELSEEDHAAVVEAIAKSIQYIIKLNAINGSIELNGATYDEEYGVYTAHEEDEVSVTVRPDDGFELDSLTATGQYTLIDNGDGTWTLIIHRGGGVTLTATISERSIQPPAPVEEESEPTPPPFTHPALYKIVKFGHYDFDGDGTAEELEWKIFYVTNGYAKMALVNRVDEIPEDFATTAFSDEEKEAIKDNEEGAKDITMLDDETAKRVFNEQDSEQKHITMWVKLSALVY